MTEQAKHEPTDRVLKRLLSRRVAPLPPGMVADRCWYSSTGYAACEVGPDGEPGRCTCRPCPAPDVTNAA